MTRKRKLLASVCFLFLFGLACSSSFKGAREPYAPDTIYGTWEYRSCSYKNTRVKGTVTFRGDGVMVLNASARDDYPVRPIRGTYRFTIEGNRIVTDYDKGYGMEEYYLIKGNELYLSPNPITGAESQDDPRLGANWRFRLVRAK